MINKLVAAALTVVVSLGMAGMVNNYTVAAVQDAPGNNGTLKVHEAGTPSGTESNDPKVCKFNFEGFGFDNLQDGYIMIEPQGGSSPIGEPAGPISAGPADENGYFATAYLNDGGTVVKNGTYKATLYGKDGPSEEESLAEEKAKSKVFKVECEGGSGGGVPGSAVNLVCPTNTYTLTVANTGTTVLAVKINGVDRTIDIGSAAISADFKVGDTLTVLVDGEPITVQGKVLNNYKLPACAGGMGTTSGTTGTPATPVVASTGFGAGAGTDVTSLPVTSGNGAQIASVIVMLGTTLAAAGMYAARARESFSL